MVSESEEEQRYRLNDWIRTTPIRGMFDNDNAHVLTIGSHGVFVAPPQKETAFAHSRANKAVMYGITQREGVMLATDKSRAGFLAAPIRIADGLQRETLTTIAQMDTPSSH